MASDCSLRISKGISTLCKYDTELSADSVEWCPHTPYRNFFVCGNYQLCEEGDASRKRLGRILLFSVSLSPKCTLTLHQTVNVSAVLDQKWCYNKINDSSLLGVVDSAGKLEIYKLESSKDVVALYLVTSFQIPTTEGTETLLLSLDWSTGKYQSQTPKIICSDSKGDIHLFRFFGDNLELENTWHAHDFEAWIAGFYYWDINIMFTGGDDSVLLMFDERTGKEAVVKNKTHEAGVTAFHSNLQREFLVATGSYDCYVRLWDIRKMKTPMHSLQMPGTVWRLKWDPYDCTYLLAACMLGGAHVINTSDKDKPVISGSYYEHENITYGIDWSYLPDEVVQQYEAEGNRMIATCSFYDHLLCVSKFNTSNTEID